MLPDLKTFCSCLPHKHDAQRTRSRGHNRPVCTRRDCCVCRSCSQNWFLFHGLQRNFFEFDFKHVQYPTTKFVSQTIDCLILDPTYTHFCVASFLLLKNWTRPPSVHWLLSDCSVSRHGSPAASLGTGAPGPPSGDQAINRVWKMAL